MCFDLYIGIDYSGAGTANTRLANLQVYASVGNEEPNLVRTPNAPAGRHWNRREVVNWLLEILQSNRRLIVGIDHAFSFPASYFHRNNLADWGNFLDHITRGWDVNTTVGNLRLENPNHGGPDEFRLTETWTSSAKSVFDFGPNGVAFSSHAGIPWLQHIRQNVDNQVQFWPFDGWEVRSKSVIVEAYPSIFHNRFPRLTNGVQRTGDQQDAYSVARWLWEFDQRDILLRYFNPPLTDAEREIARLEGWILGIA